MIIELAVLAGGAAWLARRLKRATAAPVVDPPPPARPAEPEHDAPSATADERAPLDDPREVDRALTMMAVGAGMTGAGLLVGWPALFLAGAVPVSLPALPLVRRMMHAYREGDGRGLATLDVIAVLGAILTGHVFAASIGGLSAFTSMKLLARTRRETDHRLAELFGAELDTAWVLEDGVEVQRPVGELERGDLVVVVAGAIVPVDGRIVEGSAWIDEHMLTGESRPAEKGIGDDALAATLVIEGRIHIRCERTGSESVAAEILAALGASRAYTETLSSRGMDVVEAGAAPTLGLTAITLPLLGVQRALAVSYASFGYSMRLAAPIGMLNHLALCATQGILVKDGRALEQLARVDTFVFDKTGTLTDDVPVIERIATAAGHPPAQVLAVAAALEARQQHPFAAAIVAEAERRGAPAVDARMHAVHAGAGIEGRLDGAPVFVGSRRLIDRHALRVSPALESEAAAALGSGASVVFVAIGHEVIGLLALRPRLRPEAAELVAALQARGLRVEILSGDREAPTRELADRVGADRWHAEVLPEDKATVVQRLMAEGRRVCFVGDGINDALALQAAHVSVSMSGATRIATDAASVVLMEGGLASLLPLLTLSNQADTQIKVGTALSIVPGAICVIGVYGFGLGVGGAIGLYASSLLGNVANALLPLARHRDWLRAGRLTREALESRLEEDA